VTIIHHTHTNNDQHSFIWGKDPFASILGKLDNCVVDLRAWGKNLKLSFRAEIDRCKKDVEAFRASKEEDIRDEEGIRRYEEAREAMGLWLNKEDAFW